MGGLKTQIRGLVWVVILIALYGFIGTLVNDLENNDNITFKYEELADDWLKLDPICKKIALFVIKKHPSSVITEIYRTRKEQEQIYGKNTPDSPHQKYMAIDIIFTDKTVDGYEIEKEINELWEYNPKTEHKVALYHKIIGKRKHLHIQVGYLTRMR